tara:strand:- start:457 stop:1623 length:1167 start_codon:yes stop_codon:yes gene_type:complete
MSEQNPQDSHSVENKLAMIEELQGKIKLLKRGLFFGVLSLLALGSWIIYNNVLNEAKPAIEIAKDVQSTFNGIKPKLDTAMGVYNRNSGRIENLMNRSSEIMDQTGEFASDIQTTIDSIEKWKELGEGFQTNTEGQLLENLQGLTTVYTEMQPDIEKAFKTLDGFVGNDEEFAAKMRADFEIEYENTVKPAAEDLAKKILVDIQGEAGEKFSELATHADEIMAGATGELHALTNGIPDKVKFALDQTLVKTINDRDEKLRKMFPKLTKEKQAALVSRLSALSKEQSEKIFLNLFADHVSELGKASDALMKIQQTEPNIATSGGKLGDVQTSLALLSAILEIAKGDFSTQQDYTTPKEKPEDNGKTKEKQTSIKSPKKSTSKEQTVENK